jgi:hypothetical protein
MESAGFVFSKSCLCFGFLRSAFGVTTREAGTVPTRSRAIAFNSFVALYFFGFRAALAPGLGCLVAMGKFRSRELRDPVGRP